MAHMPTYRKDNLLLRIWDGTHPVSGSDRAEGLRLQKGSRC